MKTSQYFINEESDFFNYMIDNKLFKNPQTYKDYVDRVRYVSNFFKLDKSFDEEQFQIVSDYLINTMTERDRYNSKKGIYDLKSGLRKFLLYAQSDYIKSSENEINLQESSIRHDEKLSVTEKEMLIKARVGQGDFRKHLIDYWDGCSITQCQTFPLLIASHIKPWKAADNSQRLDVFNGLLLTPNLDKLFDKGYITFDRKGQIVFSKHLPDIDKEIMSVNKNTKMTKIEDKHIQYLKYHYDNCFLG